MSKPLAQSEIRSLASSQESMMHGPTKPTTTEHANKKYLSSNNPYELQDKPNYQQYERASISQQNVASNKQAKSSN